MLNYENENFYDYCTFFLFEINTKIPTKTKTNPIALDITYPMPPPVLGNCSLFILSPSAVKTGASFSILSIITILFVTLPAISVAIKVKLPFSVKVYEDLFNVPSLVDASTVMSLLVGPVV